MVKHLYFLEAVDKGVGFLLGTGVLVGSKNPKVAGDGRPPGGKDGHNRLHFENIKKGRPIYVLGCDVTCDMVSHLVERAIMGRF